MKEKHETPFGLLAHWVIGHARLTAVMVVVLTAASLFACMNLKVESDIVKLLPANEPSTIALKELTSEGAGVTTILTITIGGASAEVRSAYLDELSTRLEALPAIRYTFHKMEPALAWRIGLMQLEPSELAEIRDRLKGAVALGPAVRNPFVAQRLLSLGPLTEKLRSAASKARLALSDDMSQLIVRPTGQPTDIPHAKALMDDVYKILDETDPESRGLKVLWVGGAFRHNVEDYQGIVQDIARTSLAAILLVFLVIALAFRDPRAILLVLLPLLLGNIWTLGFASVAVGSLNSFTSYIFAVLIGMGIAFSIHLYSRYREERAGGGSLEKAVVRAWDKAGVPCFAAALTSACGFMALFLARFRGFQQLGLLLGVGVMVCLVSVLVVLPVLIMWRERATSPIPLKVRKKTPHRPPTYRLAPLGLLLGLLVTLVAAFQLGRVGFQYDLSELRRDGLAYDDLNDTERSLARESYSPLVATYPTQEALRSAYERVVQDIDSGDLAEIERALSVFTVIPPDQEERIAVLEEIAELTRNENFKYLPGPVQENLSSLADGPIKPLTPDDLPEKLKDLLGGTEGKHRMLLLPSGNMWDLRQTAHLNEVVQERFKGVSVAGQYLCLGSLYNVIREDAPKVVGLAFLLVGLVTLFDLKTIGRGFGAMGVLVAGMFWAGGALGVMGIDLSIINIVGIPILLGIGVDVIIHLLHRLAEEGPGRILHSLATTGWAAALSTATTVLSFAALALASSRGVRSLGLLVVVGLTAITVAAFLLLPLGWATAWKVTGDLNNHGNNGRNDLR